MQSTPQPGSLNDEIIRGVVAWGRNRLVGDMPMQKPGFDLALRQSQRVINDLIGLDKAGELLDDIYTAQAMYTLSHSSGGPAQARLFFQPVFDTTKNLRALTQDIQRRAVYQHAFHESGLVGSNDPCILLPGYFTAETLLTLHSRHIQCVTKALLELFLNVGRRDNPAGPFEMLFGTAAEGTDQVSRDNEEASDTILDRILILLVVRQRTSWDDLDTVDPVRLGDGYSEPHLTAWNERIHQLFPTLSSWRASGLQECITASIIMRIMRSIEEDQMRLGLDPSDVPSLTDIKLDREKITLTPHYGSQTGTTFFVPTKTAFAYPKLLSMFLRSIHGAFKIP